MTWYQDVDEPICESAAAAAHSKSWRTFDHSVHREDQIVHSISIAPSDAGLLLLLNRES